MCKELEVQLILTALQCIQFIQNTQSDDDADSDARLDVTEQRAFDVALSAPSHRTLLPTLQVLHATLHCLAKLNQCKRSHIVNENQYEKEDVAEEEM